MVAAIGAICRRESRRVFCALVRLVSWDTAPEVILTCCHPSLAEEARITLTLRDLCGLANEAIASAFLIGLTEPDR